jgi:hypothetical protein
MGREIDLERGDGAMSDTPVLPRGSLAYRGSGRSHPASYSSEKIC